MSERLPVITAHLSDLAAKNVADREKMIREEEEYQNAPDFESDDDDAVADDGDPEFEDAEKEDKDYQKTLAEVSKLRNAAFGKDVDSDGDHSSDSDYDYAGGDMALYDSKLEAVDELEYISESLQLIMAADPTYMNHLISQISTENQAIFQANLAKGPQLKQKEKELEEQAEKKTNKELF